MLSAGRTRRAARRFVSVALLLAVLLLVFVTVTLASQRDLITRVAATYATGPCAHSYAVFSVTGAELDAAHPETGPMYTIMAQARVKSCIIEVSWQRVEDALGTRRAMCELMAHEFLHLGGHLHSDNPASLMHANPDFTRVRGGYCARIFPYREQARCMRSWPVWARVTATTRRLYFEGDTSAAKRAFKKWRAAHPNTRLKECDVRY